MSLFSTNTSEAGVFVMHILCQNNCDVLCQSDHDILCQNYHDMPHGWMMISEWLSFEMPVTCIWLWLLTYM